MSDRHMPATVSQTPVYDGDGYGFGGDNIVTISGLSVSFGPRGGAMAETVARLWNSHDALLEALEGLMEELPPEGPSEDWWENTIDKARAAIALARGTA